MSKREVTVRTATTDDAPWILGSLRAFSAAYGTHRQLFPPSEEQARATLEGMMSNGAFFVALDATGERQGFVGGVFFDHPFNPELRTLTELFWWVSPQHRARTNAAAALLDAFTAHGRTHAQWVTFTHIVGKTGVRFEQMTRRGYHMQEFTFLLEVDRINQEA